ncbi:hypothetical protein LRB11_17115, partial [Ectothiorhodospira haloalkaliphila]|uniref:hypothetical protein n=1 Tax=Ectothiorhodospira haloalkaliphila TaxID=421628 RepID=UPI001EE7A59A
MSTKAEAYVNSFLQSLAGEGVELSEQLKGVFARILARQVDVDEDGQVTPKAAFETLGKVFTFVASPAGSRPAEGPIAGYSE